MNASSPAPVQMRTSAAFRRIAAGVSRQRRIFAEAMIGTFVLNVVGLATSIYTMQVYDRVIPNNGLATLWVLSAGVLLAVVLELALKHTRAVMVDKATKAIDIELSDAFFQRALHIRMDRRPRTIGTFAAQIRMFEQVRAFLTSTTLFVLADIPFAVLFIGVIAWIAGPVALVPLALLPVSLVTGLLFVRPTERLTDAHVQESNVKNGLLIESIDGIETIKALTAERSFAARWNALTLRISESELALKSLSGLSAHLVQLTQQLSYIGLIAAGVYAINAGTLTMGGLIACSIISGRALMPIAQIAGLLVQWQHAKAALRGLEAIMQSPADGEGLDAPLVKPETCRCSLRLEDVQFSYDRQFEALNVPRLEIASGERIGVIGPVGSGKSTLLKLLSGLYQPWKGRAFLDNVDLAHLDPAFVRAHIGYLPQDARLFNGSLRENLVLGLGADPGDEAILAAARATGLDRVIAQHPRGLGLMIAEGGLGLSGGQRQLVTLTRLLLGKRDVLLLDEPTASIDGPLEEQVGQAVLGTLAPHQVVVMVTHKTALLRYATRIVIVERGRVVMDGPRDAVLSRILQKPQPAEAAS